ncbi:helix-turn-helix domain-containing protein [Priestia endophytica]
MCLCPILPLRCSILFMIHEKTSLLKSRNKSASNTAKQLHIHINTLYQRLKKIEKQLNLSFDNPEDALKIQLACHLRETFFYLQI